jgi:hypothetical protein
VPPLAHRIAKELTLPLKDRTFQDEGGLLRRMDDIHCFEISAIADLARDLADKYPQYGAPDDLIFPPAQKTWLELKTDYGRCGFLVIKGSDTGLWDVIRAVECRNGLWKSDEWAYRPEQWRLIAYGPTDSDGKRRCADVLNKLTKSDNQGPHSSDWFRAVFAIINTPRIMSRKTHAPHRGLEKNLIAKQKALGKFPLRAWTEIVLEVNVGKHAAATGTRETHLTGERARHWTRAHVRIQRGRLQVVRDYWSGNAALGIVRSRHIVKSGGTANPPPHETGVPR